MPDEPDQKPEPTQRTPKGLEIPVPTRKDVMAALRKVSEPDEDAPPIVDEDSA
jgi:hypothetical protein